MRPITRSDVRGERGISPYELRQGTVNVLSPTHMRVSPAAGLPLGDHVSWWKAMLPVAGSVSFLARHQMLRDGASRWKVKSFCAWVIAHPKI